MYSRLLLGVGASVAGSLGHSLGMTLQKRAHMRLEAIDSSRPLWKDKQWQLGLLLYLFSSTAPPMLALSMLPVFVAAPLAAVGLVANAVFARYILASTFVHADMVGTLLVTLGSMCVAVFGAIDEPLLSLRQLMLLYRRPAYVVFFAVYATMVVALIAAEIYWRRRYDQARRGSRANVVSEFAVTPNVQLANVASRGRTCGVEAEPLLATLGPVYSSTSTTPSPVYSSASTTPSLVDAGSDAYFAATAGVLPCEAKTSRAEQVARYVSGFLSAVISGLICSQTLLLAKSGIGLVVLTLQGDMQFNDPLALAIVIGLVITALSNLYYIQRALRLCSTLTVVPLCYCSSSLSALLSSLVYFDQFPLLSPVQVAMIAMGICLLGTGVLLLSLKTEPHEGPLHLDPEPTND
ncbi:hypothetical protein GGH12_003440 [Coemansia sp. RSA 1822]|nr:hypothetical protein LPJ76_003233 [Coemansia sp. RSA 638]KAJ2120723.1 hypothetical protein IW147_004862 [Coemansia sp. RSA 720]KAJ2542008.1 hypothetical protein GGF49_003207 [Coemansia sp. RSA 1853]KAJ2562137.1 hypothetical protein GGH12_003440 [Coemansia sp. RSA 1822]